VSGPRTALVVNVRARRGEEWFERARAGLAERGVEVTGAHAVEPAELSQRVRDELARGAERVVVGGGDGSLAAAAGVLAGTRAALGVLPLGTANDFARSLHIPDDLEGALRVIARGAVRAVDVAWLGDHAFLNAASLGVSSELTRRLEDGLKRRAGKLAYPVAAPAAAVGQPAFKLRIELDGRVIDDDALQVVVGNGRYHGGGRLIAPHARIDDHRLDVYVLSAASDAREATRPDRLRDLAALARYAWLLLRGKHLDHPRVFHARSASVRVHTVPPIDIDADGELAGRTPAEFRVLPGQLRVIAPPRRRPWLRARARAVDSAPTLPTRS
jgi:YegS/Rv2252/BmrU family lipid kinase